MLLRHRLGHDARLLRQGVRLNAHLRFRHGFSNDAGLFRQNIALNIRLRFRHNARLFRQSVTLGTGLRLGDDTGLFGQSVALNPRLRFRHNPRLFGQSVALYPRLRLGDDARLFRQHFLLHAGLGFRDRLRHDAGLGRQSLRLNARLRFRHRFGDDARLFGQSVMLDARLGFRDRLRHNARLRRQSFGLQSVLRFGHGRRDRLGLRRDRFRLRRRLGAHHRLRDRLRLRCQRFIAHGLLRVRQRHRDFLRLFGKRFGHQSRLETLGFLLPVHQLPHRFRQNRALRLRHDIRDQLRLFRRRHSAAVGHRRSARFQHGLFLHFQNFFLRFDLRLRHRLGLRGDRFRRLRRRQIAVFNHDLRHLHLNRLRRSGRRHGHGHAALLHRRKQRRQRFIRVFLGIRDRPRDQVALHFGRVLLGFGKGLGHRARRHFLTLRKDFGHCFRLRFGLYLRGFDLRLRQRVDQSVQPLRSGRGQLFQPALHPAALHLQLDDGRHGLRLRVLHTQFFLNAFLFAGCALSQAGCENGIVLFSLFQRLRQFGDFVTAGRILTGFGQRFRQQFHIAARFLLRLLHHGDLVLVHFFLRG